MSIRIVPLGAGQDVGKSCILVSMYGKNIMFDCGMHMGFNDERKFPDFTYISPLEDITQHIDCVLISHFHLDHCGSLPYLTEMIGYQGPVYMTHPTRAICPVLIEDFRKIAAERKGDTNIFTSQMIKNCMNKVTTINLHQCIKVDNEIEVKAYYAGHVLGAAMFRVKVRDLSVVYTGDFNVTPDRHLGSAWIDRCRPNVLISESTYATTVRDSRRCREIDFLKKVHETIENNGKVLIPTFALGRAQELCILLEQYWDRMNLNVPIFFSTGMTEKATNYYKLFISWTNQRIKSSHSKRHYFDFRHIKPFDRSMIDRDGPMVVLAAPGMLHAGLSLQLFKKWAGDPKNAVILPGYCVMGTVGYKVLSGQKQIDVDGRGGPLVDVNLQVLNMSFSAHADASGIIQLIEACQPKDAVVFVHGEAAKMAALSPVIVKEFKIDCFHPMNGQLLVVKTKSKKSNLVHLTCASLSVDEPNLVGCSSFQSPTLSPALSPSVYSSSTLSLRQRMQPEIKRLHGFIVINKNVDCKDYDDLTFSFYQNNEPHPYTDYSNSNRHQTIKISIQNAIKLETPNSSNSSNTHTNSLINHQISVLSSKLLNFLYDQKVNLPICGPIKLINPTTLAVDSVELKLHDFLEVKQISNQPINQPINQPFNQPHLSISMLWNYLDTDLALTIRRLLTNQFNYFF